MPETIATIEWLDDTLVPIAQAWSDANESWQIDQFRDEMIREAFMGPTALWTKAHAYRVTTYLTGFPSTPVPSFPKGQIVLIEAPEGNTDDNT